MPNTLRPLPKQSLSDRLARQIQHLIQEGEYKPGDRLPPIMKMARSFGVGHPTVREALKKLETIGVVEIRHGSGVYVTRNDEVLIVATPEYTGTVTKKLLVDLIQARIPIETQTIALAVRNATPEHLKEMRRLLDTAGENLQDDEVLNVVNMAFHRQIALASGNMVLTQVLTVLAELFAEEQRLILGIFGSRERDHEEHVQLLEALEQRDEQAATRLMHTHLAGVEDAILRWHAEEGRA